MEAEIVHFLNELGMGTAIDSISWLISYIPFLIILFAFFAVLVIVFDRKKWKVILLALVIAIILHFLITEFFFKDIAVSIVGIKERPYIVYPGINTIGELQTDSSFPSGHVAAVCALLTVFVYFYRKNKFIIIGAVIFAVFEAFSRIHNGMHYPIDVLAGAILGICYGLAGVYLSKKFMKSKFKNKLFLFKE